MFFLSRSWTISISPLAFLMLTITISMSSLFLSVAWVSSASSVLSVRWSRVRSSSVFALSSWWWFSPAQVSSGSRFSRSVALADLNSDFATHDFKTTETLFRLVSIGIVFVLDKTVASWDFGISVSVVMRSWLKHDVTIIERSKRLTNFLELIFRTSLI